MSKPKLIIMVGNIASGKTTWIKKFLNISKGKDFVVVSKDALRRMIGGGGYIYNERLEPIIHSCIIDMMMTFMDKGMNIVYDETNMDKETRYPFLLLTKKFSRLGYNYETTAVVMPRIFMNQSLKRRKLQEGINWGGASQHIWEQVWRRKNSLFEMPTIEEGFDVVTIINEDGKEILPV